MGLKKKNVMTKPEKIVYVLLLVMGLALTLNFAVWWFSFKHIPHNYSGWLHILDISAFLILTYVVWYQIIYELFSWYISGFVKDPVPPPDPVAGLKVAMLTAFVPIKEPYGVLENTLKAMVEVKYKHDTWVLDEGDDDYTKAICKQYGVKHYSRKNTPQYNTEEGKYKAKTKAGNYNSWFDLHSHKYDFVAEHDVDFVPNPNFLLKTLGHFHDPDIGFVGSPQIYGNKDESWIARGAAEQQYGFYGPTQRGLAGGHDMSLFIGANHVVRISAHKDISGYSGHIVEDHLTGMNFYAKKWKSVYVPEVLAVGEGPATWDSYFGQQMRWAYGLIDILLNHSPRIFKKMYRSHMIHYFLLQQYYFFGLTQILGIILILLYLVFGFQSTSMDLGSLVISFVPLLIIQLAFFFWLQRFNIVPKEEKGFLIRGKLLNLAAWPVYLVAFIEVVLGKKLMYVVTPKGANQNYETSPLLFVPHFVIGTMTGLGTVIGISNGHDAPQILFWAGFNTFVMYSFFFGVLFSKLRARIFKLSEKRLTMLPR